MALVHAIELAEWKSVAYSESLGGDTIVDEIAPGLRSIFQMVTRTFERTATAFVFEHAAFDGRRARSFSAAFQFSFLNGFFSGLLFPRAERLGQTFARQRAILRLRTRVLNGDDDAGRNVTQRYFRGDLIDVLPARSGGSIELFFEFRFLERLIGWRVHGVANFRI